MAMTIVRTWTVSSQTTSVSTSTETTNEGGGVRSLKSAVAHSNDINGSGAIDAESGGIMAHTEASQQLRGHAV
jgi:hypothetical protein